MPTLIWLDQSSPFFSGFFRLLVRAKAVGAARTRSDPAGLVFSLKGSFLSRLFLPRRGGGPDRDASLRRLINLIFACWLTHSMIRQGLPRSTGRASGPPRARAQGWAEGSPDPYTRRGLVGRPSGPDPDCLGIPRHDAPLLHGSSRQQHLLTGNRPDEPRQLPRHRCHRPSRWLAPLHQTE